MCKRLNELNIQFYRHKNSNILTIRSQFVDPEVATKFGLVPDDHSNPKWFKIVIMEHVTIEKLTTLVEHLKESVQLS